MKIDFRNDILPLKNQLYRLALRITLDSAEAEDVVQETLIKVWNKRDCFTVCRNLALDSVKNKRSQTESLDDKPVEKPDNTFNPSDKVIEKDQVSIVREIIDSLPEKQRECIQLRDFEGKAYKDIAALLGMTEEQVKVNIFRARQAVKQRFQAIDGFEARG